MLGRSPRVEVIILPPDKLGAHSDAGGICYAGEGINDGLDYNGDIHYKETDNDRRREYIAVIAHFPFKRMPLSFRHFLYANSFSHQLLPPSVVKYAEGTIQSENSSSL